MRVSPRSSAAIVGATAGISAWLARHHTSAIVRSWSPPQNSIDTGGLLAHRASHVSGDRVGHSALLLHGLGASNRYFGSMYDRIDGADRVIIPDLLGFGEDRDPSRTDFSFDAHLDALCELIAHSIPEHDRISIGAHSMGSALGLGLAHRLGDRVRRVVLWGPPVYASATDAADDASSHTAMARLLLTESDRAERLCRLNCANPTAMGWVMAVCAPTMPIPVARDASRHTWHSFEGSLRSLVLDVEWETLFDVATPVTIVRGTDDKIGDIETLRDLVGARRHVDSTEIDGADHHVAITHWTIGRELLGTTD